MPLTTGCASVDLTVTFESVKDLAYQEAKGRHAQRGTADVNHLVTERKMPSVKKPAFSKKTGVQ